MLITSLLRQEISLSYLIISIFQSPYSYIQCHHGYFIPIWFLLLPSVVVMNSLALLCSILITLRIRLSLFSHSYAESHLSTNLLHIPVYKASSFTSSLQRFFSC